MTVLSSHPPNFPPGLDIYESTKKLEYHSEPNNAAPAGRVAQDIERFGIAGRHWEGAFALADYLHSAARHECNKSESTGLEFDPPSPVSALDTRTVLDLGSGTGLLGISSAAFLRRSRFVLTDLPEVLDLLERNVSDAPETVRPRLFVRPLAWGDAQHVAAIKQEFDTIDVICASDLVYFPFLYPALLRTMLDLTHGERMAQAKIIVSYKVRSLVREEPFWTSFARWFDFVPVLSRSARKGRKNGKDSEDKPWTRYGEEDGVFVFVASRRRMTLEMTTPSSDDGVMRGPVNVQGGSDAACCRTSL